VRSQAWWDTARAGGIISWALLTLAVVTGLQLSTRLVRRPAPAWVLDLHRFLGGLAVAFLGVHLLGLIVDTYVGFGATDILVPFATTYHTTEVALGVVAMYLLLAIEISSLLMKRMSRRLWHGIHLTSYVLFPLATIHGILVGTDRHNALLIVSYLLAATVILFMTLVRLLAPRRGRASKVDTVTDAP
jgi:sulfoxide reductase heme-binding subunit YedZ